MVTDTRRQRDQTTAEPCKAVSGNRCEQQLRPFMISVTGFCPSCNGEQQTQLLGLKQWRRCLQADWWQT
jgi:hypothetical protein